MGKVRPSARVSALMERMTLEEKLGQLSMLADGLVETGPPGPHNPFTMIEEGRVGSLLNVWGLDLILSKRAVWASPCSSVLMWCTATSQSILCRWARPVRLIARCGKRPLATTPSKRRRMVFT